MFYPHRTKRGPSYSLSSISAALHTHVESPPPPFNFWKQMSRPVFCRLLHVCVCVEIRLHICPYMHKWCGLLCWIFHRKTFRRRSCYHHLHSIGVENQPRKEMKRSLLIFSSSWSDLFKQGMQKLTQCRVSICRASIESLDICIALLWPLNVQNLLWWQQKMI